MSKTTIKHYKIPDHITTTTKEIKTEMGHLAPVLEEPINEEEEEQEALRKSRSKKNYSWPKWVKFKNMLHLSLPTTPPKKSNLKLLLGVLACPLSPLSVTPSIPKEVVSSRAQYILQQYKGATWSWRREKDESTLNNLYVSGKVSMSMVATTEVDEGRGLLENGKGNFVFWKMEPGMWMMEMAMGGCQVMAGSDGKVAWRHTPWLGTHAAPGGARPLRRALQGLDPLTTMSVFSTARYMGENWMEGESCFALLSEVEKSTLSCRSDDTSEIIKHIVVGHFSQKTGLLIHLEDFQLSRIKTQGSQPTFSFWETRMASWIEDYRRVDEGMLIAHAGRSTVSVVRFGRGIENDHKTVRMEEEWSIEDVAFDVHGLSSNSFASPEEVRQR